MNSFFEDKTKNIFLLTAILIAIFLIWNLLVLWSKILIPFIIAFLLSLLLLWITSFIVEKFKIPRVVSFILSIWILILFFYIIYIIINNNLQLFINKLPFYQELLYRKINNILFFTWLSEHITISEIFKNIKLKSIAIATIDKILILFSNIWIIIIYTIFILLELKYIEKKLMKVINNKRKKSFLKIYNNIKNNISTYFKIKFLLSLLVGFLSLLVMFAFWLEFALFLSLLIFLLNFVPIIWSIVAVSFPVILSFILFDSILLVILLWFLLILIQVSIWNIIEPKLMWNKLNLSPLTILFALSTWWLLWGIPWMVLSIPLMIMLHITLSQIPQTQNIAILLSEKWDIEIHNNE